METKEFAGKTDEQLAGLTQQGNVEAFGFLVKKYQDRMQRYIKRIIQGHEEANDISQNVFLKAFENIQGFNTKQRFSPWIYRIAHNETVNYLRKKKPLLLFDFDVFLPHYNLGKDDIENEAEKKDLSQKIERFLGELSLKQKEVLLLYYFQELSYQEIADVLKIPIATVGVRIKRAKEAIKEIASAQGGFASGGKIYANK
ncbi:MAG: RNA polymerase sigma factor [Candidatus Pacebacteria bacterium]|nr:RNA polymerase sigma factor [Candidatus Paceibacterota bacterium]